MNITATLIGQMLTFAVFVWFTMRFVWGPLVRIMDERNKRIADGLAAAERGQHEQQLAEKRAKETLQEAKDKASEIINQAHKRANEMVEEAKDGARSEGERLLAAARTEIDQERNRAREQLRGHVVTLAVAGAERILEREVDAGKHRQLLDELAAQI
ncbi:MAG: F0F1 ATP synthase subunit B [Gammaproteobacteria bacterium]|nr:F0F1 ATP synthase subunit B [Gammaproteobacteria bacterium]NIR98837.1 F0F1 ATP synthase subunit B [Gammaproteobacteria bacterium]